MVNTLGEFLFGVEDGVGGKHVINTALLGGFFALEGVFLGKVLSVIVSQVVVGDHRAGSDTGGDQEVGEGGLEFGLSRFEVVSDDEGSFTDSELDNSGNKGVLGRSIDEWGLLKDTGNSVDGRGRDFLVSGFDSSENILGGIVDSSFLNASAFSVSGPHDDDLIKSVGLFEVSDVLPDDLNVLPFVVSGNDVVGSVRLVGGDELGVKNGWEWDQVLSVGSELLLEIIVEDSGSLEGISDTGAADVPSGDNDLRGVDKGKDILHGEEDFFSSIDSDLGGGGLCDGAIVIRLLDAFLGSPGDVVFVGEDTSCEGGSVVASETDKHDTELGDLEVGLELVLGLNWGEDSLASSLLDLGGGVGVVGDH